MYESQSKIYDDLFGFFGWKFPGKRACSQLKVFFFSMKSFFTLNALKIVREFSPQISFQEKFKKEKTGTVAEPGMANKVR